MIRQCRLQILHRQGGLLTSRWSANLRRSCTSSRSALGKSLPVVVHGVVGNVCDELLGDHGDETFQADIVALHTGFGHQVVCQGIRDLIELNMDSNQFDGYDWGEGVHHLEELEDLTVGILFGSHWVSLLLLLLLLMMGVLWWIIH